ncbi:hypothetical protein BJ165DRAFT_1527351 [Panaeolus papilionaceus]|nr:hypothetical protein BJ165DRAFT_1527351 [Panaeolus papilionaceus]
MRAQRKLGYIIARILDGLLHQPFTALPFFPTRFCDNMFAPAPQEFLKNPSQDGGFYPQLHPNDVILNKTQGFGCPAPTLLRPQENEGSSRTIYTASNAIAPDYRARANTRYAGFKMEHIEQDGALFTTLCASQQSKWGVSLDTDAQLRSRVDACSRDPKDPRLPDFNVRGLMRKCAPSKFCCPNPGSFFCTTNNKPHTDAPTDSWTGSAYGGPAPVFTLDPKDINPLDN